MGTTRMRAVIASEDSVLRGLIAEAVERHPGVQVVGQARNAIEAVAHARNLRPEIAVVDTRLPYLAGLDYLPMSRISGLDTAMNIVEELPEGTVIVFSSAAPGASVRESSPRHTAVLCRRSQQTCIPIDLATLNADDALTGKLVFADVRIRQGAPARSHAREVSHRMMLLGGLAIAGGLALMFTVVFAPAGVLLASLGAISVLGGLLTTAAARCWLRSSAPTRSRA